MDGEIPPSAGQAIQADHWSQMTYTAFIQVISWIRSDVWTSRSSEIAPGDAVTVEPPEKSVPGSIEPAEGSFAAEVVDCLSSLVLNNWHTAPFIFRQTNWT